MTTFTITVERGSDQTLSLTVVGIDQMTPLTRERLAKAMRDSQSDADYLPNLALGWVTTSGSDSMRTEQRNTLLHALSGMRHGDIRYWAQQVIRALTDCYVELCIPFIFSVSTQTTTTTTED